MEMLAGPLFSVVLVVIAGMALRYALWLGADRETQRAKDTINEFEVRIRTLHETLEKEQGTQRKLCQDLEQANHDLASQQREVDQACVERNAYRVRVSELEQQLARLQREAEQRNVEIGELMDDRHAQEERQVADASQLGEENQALKQQLRLQLNQREALATEVDKFRTELETLLITRETQQAELEELRATQEDEVALLRKRLGASERDVEASEATVESLQRQLQEALEENEHLGERAAQAANMAGQLHTLTEAHTSWEQTMSDLREDLAIQATAIDRLQAERDAESERALSAEQELAFAKDQLVRRSAELDEACQQREQLRLDIQLQRESLAEQTAARESLAERTRDLEIERDELVRGIKREQDQHGVTIRRCEELQQELGIMSELQQQLDEQAEVAIELERQLADARETQAVLNEHRQALEATQIRFESAEREHASKLQQTEVRLSESERAVAGLEETCAQKDRQLADCMLEQQRLRTQVEAEQQVRRQLEEKLATHRQTLEKLQTDSIALESVLTQPVDVAAGRPARRERPRRKPGRYHQEAILPFAEKQQVIQDPTLGTVYPQRPERVDDLKRISGIGQVLEDRLNELGVYTYQQIMNWSQEATERFSELLAFKDRIQRDQWLAQARRLHEETEPRAA
ncbi:MAG: hypothetical protein AAGF97_13745 [Planctomycetota bacterium]